MSLLIEIEGIIGTGKTTLGKQLAERLSLRLFEEPVDDNPYLDLFYADKKRWGFSMQMELLYRRYAIHQRAAWEATGPTGSILDRSLRGDRVFAKMLTDAGMIHELEWQTYQKSFDIMCHSIQPPSVMLWLDVSPEKALERILRRGREAEKPITIEYLRDLQDHYLDMLSEIREGKQGWTRGVRVVSVPWNVDHQSIDGLVEELRAMQ